MAAFPIPARQRSLARLGVALWSVGCLIGALLLFWMFILTPLFDPRPGRIFLAELVALGFALPACCVYVWVPVIIDRYDPEPWWALAMAFAWGAFAAAGISGFVNTFFGLAGGAVGGEIGAAFMGSVVSAPIVEEATKGLAVLGMFWFLRREFDGVVDGVIYATFSALGFALTENVLYYAQGLVDPRQGAFAFQIVFRGVLEPWGHPLYTAMFGVGVGISREVGRGFWKWAAPALGFVAAVGLHALWNGTAMLSGLLQVPLVVLLLLAYFCILGLFMTLLLVLVVREGRILREHLSEHVDFGHITQRQLDLICSPIGRLTAYLRHGPIGRDLVKVGTRLGLAKWHAARAQRTGSSTISLQAVFPLSEQMSGLSRALEPRA